MTPYTGGAFAKQISSHSRSRENVPYINPIFLEAYPLLAHPSATIAFTVPDADGDEIVSLKIFDVMGHDVTTLLNDYKQAGRYKITFEASGLPPGNYIAQCHTKSEIQCKLINVVR